jgi:cysteine desulfurase / selenocysteine lyase
MSAGPAVPARSVEARRADFPLLSQTVRGLPLAYLDNAATSQKPLAVLESLRRYYEQDNSNVHRGAHELAYRATVAFEAARERIATFFNAASTAEIIFVRGTTEAINLVARSWGDANLKEGDEILLTELEHHSNLVPWQLLAQRVGAKLRFLPITGDIGELDLEKLPEMLGPRVKLFAFTHISNALGVVNPAEELCRMARERGIVTLVDGAQSAGHLPVDVQRLGCDFYAFSGHKTCGPTGIGGLYGRRALLDAMPPFHGGGEMIEVVEFEQSTWKQPPHRFEAGTPNIADSIALGVALDYLDQVGRQAIYDHDRGLAERAAAGLASIPGIRLFGPRENRAGIVSFHLRDAHAHDLTTFADRRGVALRGGHHCCQPLLRRLKVDATTRASFYFYNTAEEADRFVEAIAAAQRYFG